MHNAGFHITVVGTYWNANRFGLAGNHNWAVGRYRGGELYCCAAYRSLGERLCFHSDGRNTLFDRYLRKLWERRVGLGVHLLSIWFNERRVVFSCVHLGLGGAKINWDRRLFDSFVPWRARKWLSDDESCSGGGGSGSISSCSVSISEWVLSFGSVSGVAFDVLAQVVRAHKPLVTNRAGKPLLSSVSTEMAG